MLLIVLSGSIATKNQIFILGWLFPLLGGSPDVKMERAEAVAERARPPRHHSSISLQSPHRCISVEFHVSDLPISCHASPVSKVCPKGTPSKILLTLLKLYPSKAIYANQKLIGAIKGVFI